MSWISSTLSSTTTRWIAGGLLALGGWALYEATAASAQTAPSSPELSPVPAVTDSTTADTPGTVPPSPAGDGSTEGAFSVSVERIETLVQQRHTAERNHLWRVAAWGGSNVAGGLALMATHDRDAQSDWWSFGMQSAAWGAVNVGIATVGLLGSRSTPDTWSDALSAERTYHDILLVNMGLNVGYSAVGGAMVIASYNDVSDASAWRGHGTALIVQGAGLLLLDTIAWIGSRSRIVNFIDMPGDLSARALPVGGSVTWRF